MSETKDYPPYLDYPKPRKKVTRGDLMRRMSNADLAAEIVWIMRNLGQSFTDFQLGLTEWLSEEVE